MFHLSHFCLDLEVILIARTNFKCFGQTCESRLFTFYSVNSGNFSDSFIVFTFLFKVINQLLINQNGNNYGVMG